MKNIFQAFTIIFGISVLISSCKKDPTTETVNQTITQTLKVNQSYQYDLGSFGDEESASISKQAANYYISLLNREINTGKVVYRYLPANNFIGTDEVQIKSARGWDGSGANNKLVYTTIQFTITN